MVVFGLVIQYIPLYDRGVSCAAAFLWHCSKRWGSSRCRAQNTMWRGTTIGGEWKKRGGIVVSTVARKNGFQAIAEWWRSVLPLLGREQPSILAEF